MADRPILSHLLTAAVVLAAIVVGGSAVRAEFATPREAADAPSVPKVDTVRVPDWPRYAGIGHHLGSSKPKVTILYFTDFECPACRRFSQGALHAVLQKYPNDVEVVMEHWPLPQHHLAYLAARASECAAAQGRFWPFYEQLYAKQDSLGIKSVAAFAADAGVPDAKSFATCSATSDAVPVVDSGKSLAFALRGTGTPLVLVNGLLFRHNADSADFDAVVRAAIAAK